MGTADSDNKKLLRREMSAVAGRGRPVLEDSAAADLDLTRMGDGMIPEMWVKVLSASATWFSIAK